MNKEDRALSATQVFEHRLWEFAERINREIGKPGMEGSTVSETSDSTEPSACSIFLFDRRRDAYVLRASTMGSIYLGKARLDTSESKRQEFARGEKKVGITTSAIFGGEPIHTSGIKDLGMSVSVVTDSRKKNCENGTDPSIANTSRERLGPCS